MKQLIITIAIMALILSTANSREISKVDIAESMKSGDKNLVLNGAGTIKKLFFKVYVIALYTYAKTNDANLLLNKDKPYVIYMHFVRNEVGADKIIEAWNEGFGKSTGGKTDKIKSEIETFNSWFKGIDMNEGSTYKFEYIPGTGVKVFINNTYKGTVAGFAFRRALLGIWLGDKPRDSGVKDDLLGDD
jgi:hypothetical protein